MDDNLFNKLACEEDKFLSSQFLSPVVRGQPVRIRIAGVVCNLHITRPKNFQGWGIFSPISYKLARYVRSPSMEEKRSYLNLFPILRLILCRRQNDVWFGILANQADTRFRINGLMPLNLAEEIQLFEVVRARFDGSMCWFDSIDQRHSPRTAIYLRESLAALLEPDKLSLSGLTREEKDAYLMAYGPALEADIESKKDHNEERIKEALRKAGAKYQSYIERDKTYTVEFIVDGDKHRSVVEKNTLQIQSAGICLSGGDTSFDLQSLVGVIREGRQRNRIVRVGNNYIEQADNYGDNYGEADESDY